MFGRLKLRFLAFFILASLLGGCVTIPQSEFRSYLDAFDEFKFANEQALLDLDEAQKIAEALETKKQVAPQSGSTPSSVNLISSVLSKKDQVSIRREALDTVVQYNSLLTELAAGRKPSEISASVDSLITGLEGVVSLADFTLEVATPVGQVVSTVIENLEKSQNRAEFIKAMQEGAPIIDAILVLFAIDAEKTYGIHFKSLKKMARKEQLNITNHYSQMILVSKDYKPPLSTLQKEVGQLNKELPIILSEVGINIKGDLPTNTSSSQDYDSIVLSQLQQTYSQIKASANRYKKIKGEQAGRYELALSYGRLISQTRSTLKHVLKSINTPETINKNSRELLTLAFDVRRKWYEIKNNK